MFSGRCSSTCYTRNFTPVLHYKSLHDFTVTENLIFEIKFILFNCYFFNIEIQIQIYIYFQKIFKIQMKTHKRKVFENAFQIQTLCNYTSLELNS